MCYLTVNGARLYYEVHGPTERHPDDAPTLVFISGLGGHIAEVPHLVDVYRRPFRFLGFDGRGCGRSEATDGEYTIAGYADDAAALLEALGIASAFIYGSSMGGMVAQELAIRHPQRVQGLILGCTTAGAIRGQPPSPETVQALIRNQTLTGDEALEAGWALGYSRAYIDANRDAMYARARAAARYATPRESYMKQVLAAARHDTYDRLARIACPTLVLHGSEDLMMPLRNGALLAAGIPGAQLRVLHGAGHGYNLEAQAEADAAVIDFVLHHHAATQPASASALR